MVALQPRTLKVAFWNVNMGISSFPAKKLAFTYWIQENQPDILFLEELSETLGGGKALINEETPLQWKMKQVGLVNTLDKNFEGSTKCLSVLVRPGLDVNVRALSLEGLGQKRLLLKLIVGGVAMWSLHANASDKGGRTATEAAASYLAKYGDAVIGGDFNYPIEKSSNQLSTIAPLSWQSDVLKFSQWKNSEGQSTGTDYHLPSSQVAQDIERHDVIDYLACGKAIKAKAIPNCATEENWRDILAFFDHCPVLYEVELLK